MITEDYVSFETAKLLKEKGFDWMELPFYSEQDRDEWTRNAWYGVPNPCYNENIPFDTPTLYVTAPHVSFQLAMKWLREVHKIHISVEIGFDVDNPQYYFFVPSICRFSDKSGEYENPFGEKEFDSCEEACEAAIKYCLENLTLDE